MKNQFFRSILPHLGAVFFLLVVACMYATPALQGKKLNLHDNTQALAGAKEVQDFHKETGEWSAWTNSMFSGMPAFLIAGDYPNSLSTTIGRKLNNLFPTPINYLWLEMLGMYLLLIVLGANPWQALLGSVAYAFASYNIIAIKAGHLSKNLALAFAPATLAGVVLALRGRYGLGAAVTAFFLAMEIYGNHIQITYYLAMAIGVFYVIEAVVLLKNGKTKQLLLASVVLAIAVSVAVGTHATRLWNNADYTKETIRGKSELSTTTAKQGSKGDGLEKDYAFNWSYGKAETFTLIVPNFYGGASGGGLDKDAAFYKAMTNKGIDPTAALDFVQKAAPVYWGSQPFTSGPAYAGAIILFLFVLGMFVIQDRIKWWLLGFTVLFTMLSWGKNFEPLTYLFFDYFPGFNKFRAITMLLSVIQLFLSVGAVLALKAVIETPFTWATFRKPLITSVALTAGLCLVLALAGGLFLDFRTAATATSPNPDLETLTRIFGDPALAQEMLTPLRDDRQAILRSDALRSAAFILLAALVLVLFTLKKIKQPVLVYGLLTVLVLADYLPIAKRYFNNSDYISKADAENIIVPRPVDEQIGQDKSLNYRVLDNTTSFMNDATLSYFHHSLGGYHGAKLRRYQEVMEHAADSNFRGVLNMLNTKYIIQQGQQGPVVQQNPEALGNAWFVPNYKMVANADDEMATMKTLDPKRLAVIDQRFAKQTDGLTIVFDSTNKIILAEARPNFLRYETNVKTKQLAVFSEIYYNVRDDWKVTLDGQPAEHFRVNYILRGMVIPQGKHTITFSFKPVSVEKGGQIDLIASILLVLVIAGGLFWERKNA